MQLGKWATWGEVTFNPDLGQFAIISVMLKELASWAQNWGFSGTEAHKRQVSLSIHLLPWTRGGECLSRGRKHLPSVPARGRSPP